MALFGASQDTIEKERKESFRKGFNEGIYALFYQLGYVNKGSGKAVEDAVSQFGIADGDLEENLVPFLTAAYVDGCKDAEDEMPSRAELKLGLNFLVRRVIEPEPKKDQKSKKEELEEKRATVKRELLKRLEPHGFIEYTLPYIGDSSQEGYLSSIPVHATVHQLISHAGTVAQELNVKITCRFCCYTNIKTVCLVFEFLDTRFAVGPKVPE
ncbi:MAG: hypothetical protein HYW89_01570 [Candidatus Sungiibacteriota bacterium]|uniref:Uncharacterized protein n=1 Tax=Candidatus Sungiibacteriota bacterium TaxID=2750080 RepID=A0A7T5RK41_9BACT|nr:MAG: hypothetical protein HYW89_01570 [Candidatus Sungbacteria bacterium]